MCDYTSKRVEEKFTLAGNCKVLSAGIRRNWYYIIFTPFRAVYIVCKEGIYRRKCFLGYPGDLQNICGFKKIKLIL